MPKGKDTATVAKMKAQIKAKKASHSQPLEVDNEEGLHSQPHSQPHGKPQEVDQNVEERMYKEVLSKVLKVNFKDKEVLKMLVGTIAIAELETVAKQIADRYQAEGITIPTSEYLLGDDMINLSAENLRRTHGV